jgi:hypothetical protein
MNMRLFLLTNKKKNLFKKKFFFFLEITKTVYIKSTHILQYRSISDLEV